jgi:hypothetical protein
MKKLLSIISLLLFSYVTFSQIKTNFTKQNYSKFFIEDCIPKDLTANIHILMVKTPFDESETDKNKELDEIFKAYYKSPYIIVPKDYKDINKIYKDIEVYKYSIVFDKAIVKYGDQSDKKINVEHIHYDLSIIDRLKSSKNPSLTITEGLSKKEQQKYYYKHIKEIDKSTFDFTAIQKTGLEDNQSKIMEMVTFLAKKLGGYKE